MTVSCYMGDDLPEKYGRNAKGKDEHDQCEINDAKLENLGRRLIELIDKIPEDYLKSDYKPSN